VRARRGPNYSGKDKDALPNYAMQIVYVQSKIDVNDAVNINLVEGY